jgi:hypothetical protein
MTLHQFLVTYVGAVHDATGLRGVESFWLHSALLSAEVFCGVAFMAWAFLRLSRYVESIAPRTVGAAISWVLMGVYCLVLMTSMLLFLEHDQIRRNPTSASEYAHFGAALAFWLLGWSPVFYLYWRRQRLSPNGA